MAEKRGPEAERRQSQFAAFGAQSQMPYERRLERYNLMVAMRKGTFPYERQHTLEQIAVALEQLGHPRLSRERVRQLLGAPPSQKLKQPTLDRSGLVARMKRWEAHGTVRGKARADEYRRQLDILDLAHAMGEM